MKFWDRWTARRRPIGLDVAHVKPREATCSRCKATVTTWRRYADGRLLCVPCADKRRK